MTKNQTTQSIDRVLNGIDSLVDVVNDAILRIKKIEIVIDGKPTDNIPSLYKDVENLKKQIESILENIEGNFVKNLNELKNNLENKDRLFILDKQGLENRLKNHENDISKIPLIENRVSTLEFNVNTAKILPKMVSFLLPICAFALSAISLYFLIMRK